MASISKSANGTRSIQFIGKDKKRRTIRLGKVSQKVAEEIKTRVEYLASAQIASMSIDGETARWLTTIGDELADKLAAVGLIAPRSRVTLSAFIEDYFTRRGEDKPNTAMNLEACRQRLVEYFTADRDLRTITPADGDAFLVWLKQNYASTTAARTFRRGRQFFRAAVRAKLITENPFDGVKTPSEVDASKQVFISKEDTLKVIAECPTIDLRLIVALARYGGIRVPSELVNLTWEDILWDKNRIRVVSPKTEHHEGKDERCFPLFSELQPFLEEAFEAAPEGAIHVITNAAYRAEDTNLRTPLYRAIRHAGLKPWPKLFVNLRSSRETELVEQFPLHVVTAWLGNTAKVAAKHYLQVTDDHFERGAKSGAASVQNPVQQGVAPLRMDSQESTQPVTGCGPMRDGAKVCSDTMYTRQDSNPSTQTPCGDRDLCQLDNEGAAKSGADSDLVLLLERWACLSVETRRAIISLAVGREVPS